jgi:hypothetical protein
MFDIDLLKPDGTADIECRSEGSGYTIVYTFGSEFIVTGQATSATITSGGNITSHGPGPNSNQYQVHLSSAPTAQHHAVALNGVPVTNNNQGNEPATLNNVPARFDLLAGDTTNNGSVNASDVGQTKGLSGQNTTGSNFRNDVTASGAINAADVSLVKSQSGAMFSQPASAGGK